MLHSKPEQQQKNDFLMMTKRMGKSGEYFDPHSLYHANTLFMCKIIKKEVRTIGSEPQEKRAAFPIKNNENTQLRSKASNFPREKRRKTKATTTTISRPCG